MEELNMAESEYLPYKSVNVFITHEYLGKVTREILTGYKQLSKENAKSFIVQFREHVNVLGFRNVIRAPLSLQINAYTSAFEGKNDVVPFTLSTWALINSGLASEVKSWLKTEGWDCLSEVRHYNDSEGFLQDWPKKLSFTKLVKNFKKAKPNVEFEDDDLILMVIWISGKLPPEDSEL